MYLTPLSAQARRSRLRYQLRPSALNRQGRAAEGTCPAPSCDKWSMCRARCDLRPPGSGEGGSQPCPLHRFSQVNRRATIGIDGYVLLDPVAALLVGHAQFAPAPGLSPFSVEMTIPVVKRMPSDAHFSALAAPAPLQSHILHVLTLRAGRQMRGIYARRVIAAVHNDPLPKRLIVGQLPRETRCSVCCATMGQKPVAIRSR
jgi:hypothetical protein